tara:strand:+ start:23519 stop:24346 length:828 start_codon:yes stop_codon:yes gene_type:complete
LRPFFLYIYLFINLLGISEVYGKSDLRYEAFARPYPLGGYARVDAGYSFKYWGKTSSSSNQDALKPSPLYGMIRPHVQFQTSGVLNSAKAFLDFHPISFWSLYVGREYTYRSAKNLDTFNCETTSCDTGAFKRNHWGSMLAMKFKKIFYMGRFQWQTTILDENPFPTFAEEQGTLLGRGKRDTLFYQTHILGVELNEAQSLAILYKRNRIRSTDQNTTMAMLLYRHQFVDPFNPSKGRNLGLSLGPGFFSTRQSTTHPSFIVSLIYNWKKGLTLF